MVDVNLGYWGEAMNTLKNVTISNCKTGIAVQGPANLRLENVTFDNVERPFDINGASNVEAKGTRIRNSHTPRSMDKSSIGYTGRNGPPLPAHCPNCNLVFPSRNYDINSSRFYGLDNEETCPDCGFEHAKLADGIFDLTDKIAKIIEAEKLTYEMFSNVGKILETLVSGQIDEDVALTQLSAISPDISSTVGTYIKSPALIGWLQVFLALLALILPFVTSTTPAPTCVIAETFRKDGRNVKYEIHLAAEQCLNRLKDFKFSEQQEVPPHHSTEINKNNELEQAETKLPLNGPVPRQKPLK